MSLSEKSVDSWKEDSFNNLRCYSVG